MDKKLKNELFRVAVDYLFREKKVGSQKELAEKIGITEPSLSRVMNGGRIISDKTLYKMNEAFGGIFNMAYFRGEDPHCMLMEDLAYYQQHPEERLVFERSQQNSSDMPHEQTSIDQSSLVNALLVAKDETIDSLKSRIADLERTIADKIEIIKAREARIAELERQLAAAATSDLSRYPFTIGAAEPSPSITKKESR